jgi:hypothetical protein
MTIARLCRVLALLGMSLSFSVHAELTEQQQKVPLEKDTQDKSLAKVVLLAGPVSNKAGQHEYFAGCALMMDWLKQTPGVWPVMAAEGWPKNEAIFDNARVVVIYMDGGENCALLEGARWEKLKSLANSSVGLIALHQSVDIPAAHAADFKSWLGGVFDKSISCRGHWDMTFDKFPVHDTTRGVQPFTAIHDGWLYNLSFAEKGVTPLISGLVPDTSRSTADAKAHAGRAEVIGWSYDRPNGGRSVGFTGADLHSSWGIESQRRFLVNSVLWTAKLPVPEKGATVPPCGEKELAMNMDFKAAAPAKKEKTAKAKAKAE